MSCSQTQKPTQSTPHTPITLVCIKMKNENEKDILYNSN